MEGSSICASCAAGSGCGNSTARGAGSRASKKRSARFAHNASVFRFLLHFQGGGPDRVHPNLLVRRIEPFHQTQRLDLVLCCPVICIENLVPK